MYYYEVKIISKGRDGFIGNYYFTRRLGNQDDPDSHDGHINAIELRFGIGRFLAQPLHVIENLIRVASCMRI